MSTELNLARDFRGTDAFLLNPSDSTFNVVLVANTVASVAVPSQTRFAFFFPANSEDFYASLDTTIAALPTGATFVNDGFAFNHNGLNVEGGTTLYFRSVNAMRLNVVFYR